MIIRSTVDLPQPDGPISTTSSPAAHLQAEVADRDGAVRVDLADVLQRIDAARQRGSVIAVASTMSFLSRVHGVALAAPATTPGNPWFSWQYVRDNADTILAALREHVVSDRGAR